MGRGAQRRRSGGGISAPPSGSPSMNEAVISGVNDAIVEYTANVTAGDFNPNDFNSMPSTETGASVAQLAAKFLTITFSGVITGDAQITYIGPDPPAVAPQTLPYT